MWLALSSDLALGIQLGPMVENTGRGHLLGGIRDDTDGERGWCVSPEDGRNRERVQFRIWVLVSSKMDGIDFPLVFRGAWLERSNF